jgi:hypothetical protein
MANTLAIPIAIPLTNPFHFPQLTPVMNTIRVTASPTRHISGRGYWPIRYKSGLSVTGRQLAVTKTQLTALVSMKNRTTAETIVRMEFVIDPNRFSLIQRAGPGGSGGGR